MKKICKVSSHRKTRRIYDKALTYEKVFSAWNTVLHTCNNKRGLFEFAMFEQARVTRILEILKKREYKPDKYRCFMIFEPKPRLVMSQSINDKVVNHFVSREYLIPILDRTLIYTNVATRKNKGSKVAMKMIKRYIAKLQSEKPGVTIYALKIDISKFFYSIDHEVLFEKLERKIKDKDVIKILRVIVGETNKPYINEVIDGFNQKYKTDIPHYEYGKGLSIGAMTSQFLAIFYLNDLDRSMKEREKCKHYIRYMDDLLFLGHDKKELEQIKCVVEKELIMLKLKVNPKSAIYNCSSKAGFGFLGYRYYIGRNGRLRIVALAKTIRRIHRRLKNLRVHDVEKFDRSKESYKGYFMKEVPRRGF